MSAEIIPCPACRHDVRVPESLFGQPVRCPACKAYFTAPTRDAQGILGTAELLADAPVVAPMSRLDDGPQARLDQSPIFVPAILLLLVGIIGSLVNGIQVYQTVANPEAAKAQVMEGMKKAAEILKQEIKQEQDDQAVEVAPSLQLSAFLISLVPLVGAIAMLRMRGWWLALFGSLGALVDVGSCCCLIGAPVGIYCLIKLCDPQIRAMFRRP